MTAVLLGKISGMSGTNPMFRDLADTKNRVSTTTDSNGNRTIITTDLT